MHDAISSAYNCGSRTLTWPILLATLAAGTWVWMSWCTFPIHAWNDIRLAPSYLWVHGHTPYPTDSGPVTTWIYGPLPLLILSIATLGSGAGAALMIAGAVNLVATIGVAIFVIWSWPCEASRQARILASAACIALWPTSSAQIIQVDNYSISFGLVANLVLARTASQRSLSAHSAWLAAALSSAGLFCKQTAVGPVVAQVLWLAAHRGSGVALTQALRLVVCASLLAALFIAVFGFQGLWLNAVIIPGQVPWTPNPIERLGEARLALIAYGLMVAMAIWGIRRCPSPMTRSLQLPALTALSALPLGMAGLFSYGGSINSLHGVPLLLPSMLAVAAGIQTCYQDCRSRIALFCSVAVVSIVVLKITHDPLRPLHPLTSHLEEAARMARSAPQSIWFPWNPLITAYEENRIDHVEDGLATRSLAGTPVDYEWFRRNLPHDWSATVLPVRSYADWGIARNATANEPAADLASDHWISFRRKANSH